MNMRALLPIALVGLMFACNHGLGFCPAKEDVQPGGACDSEELQCAYDLTTPNDTCDGTSTVVSTSCVCTKGAWSCPDPVDCSSAGGDQDSGDQGGDQGDAGDQEASTGGDV